MSEDEVAFLVSYCCGCVLYSFLLGEFLCFLLRVEFECCYGAGGCFLIGECGGWWSGVGELFLHGVECFEFCDESLSVESLG